MKILAVESSGRTFSTALNEDGRHAASFYYDCGRIHSEMIIPSVERLLRDTGNVFQDIDKFAVSTGPGSFTGIRVGMIAIKTFAQILNKPIAAVDTLSILEKSFVEIKGIKTVPAIDALRCEVYVKDGGKIVIKSIDLFIKDLKKYKNKVLVIGDAAISYKEKLSKGLGKYSVSLPYIMHMPKAQVLATMAYHSAKSTDYTKIKPLYIRRSWAEETSRK
ncbi:tRNA (adenosine(37)-N6)-threonylcarbamoyltransferase complex dimerization subunit type 1 TsaB [Candidatus Endomicrobiellum trichonymphae]|uniref:tRNA threonylcarbamoyladenosine biosynthesis protein TsaB n=1 Tax=Endomicrobium trichonymphae TaxID=1408204 RepID=B1H0F4_ENDTX|nr:tRNA (adenosine(37)-N6)-threonylcarbamoyltransferase complex dimerization subunit type 1 TsaB [Candidatus Endomicrobium trichonymphae]BAG13986.1 tRNA threonylcarbamoyladenosine biosynthesis protein TsaB [Candidatus Endomicrobium trichonymphae]